MSESTITVQGYVGSAPVLRKAGEHLVANFRLACTPRRFDRKEQKKREVFSRAKSNRVSIWCVQCRRPEHGRPHRRGDRRNKVSASY